jgi:ATP-dependent RNA helicase RhlE
VIFGGVGQGPQVAALKRGLDILVATPGRFLDLMDQGHLDISGLEIFVLDEADRMLDMGFIHDIRKIIKVLPAERQNLFFSATMANEINKLASSFLKNPVRVAVNPVSSTAELIDQKVVFVEKAHKRELLRYVLQNPDLAKVIVFTRTKHGANQVSEMLEKNGFKSAAIHGNKSQNARQKALESFRQGDVRVLVATDIAARGIDIDEITHVINFELPNVPEDYVHRIGRTARAGAKGQAIAFCNPEERVDLKSIERLTGRPLEVTEFPDFVPTAVSSPSSSGDLGRGGRREGGGHRTGHRGSGRGGGGRGGGRGRRR